MRVATIDIGTNSVLLLVAEARSGDAADLVAVHEASTITRLGQGVDHTRRLHPDAVKRTLSCLRGYAELIERHGATRVDVVSTSAARDAEGVDEFLREAEAVLGTCPRVISGQEEARLTFRGALTGLPVEGPVAVYDIGGGSTEVVVGERDGGASAVRFATSVDVGCVRLTERYLSSDPPSEEQIEQARAALHDALSGLTRPAEPARWIGIGGTITTLAAVDLQLASYDAGRVHGSRLTREAVAGLRERLAGLPLSERSAVPGLEPKRADVIVAGALLVEGLLDRAGQQETLVSDRGVRWGLALRLCDTTL